MTAPWNGLPDQPERSGWHWVKAHWNLSPRPYYWLSKDQVWYTEYGCQPPEEIISLKYSYFFPCPDPSELAQMRKVERERAAQVCERWAQACDAIYDLNPPDYSAGEADAWEDAAWAIRSLTDKPLHE